MLDLITGAAQHALDKGPRGEGPHILHHTELVEGLKYASGKRAKEVAEEHPVVHRLWALRGLNLPLPSVEAAVRLGVPTSYDDGFGKDGDAVIRALIEIGLMRPYLDKKIDVPDLYRYGYGITRMGGARSAALSGRSEVHDAGPANLAGTMDRTRCGLGQMRRTLRVGRDAGWIIGVRIGGGRWIIGVRGDASRHPTPTPC